jgi:transcriptional regulator with XRE-family HTH domain
MLVWMPRVKPEKLVRQAMAERQWTQGKLARELDIDPGVLSRLLNGGRPPSLLLAVKLERLLKVPAALWVEGRL